MSIYAKNTIYSDIEIEWLIYLRTEFLKTSAKDAHHGINKIRIAPKIVRNLYSIMLENRCHYFPYAYYTRHAKFTSVTAIIVVRAPPIGHQRT